MITTTFSNHELSESMQRLVDEWYDAPGNGREKKEYNTSEKMKLYERTEHEVTVLKSVFDTNKENLDVIANLSQIINKTFKKYPEWQTVQLVKWISQNTRYEIGPGLSFTGAYKSLAQIIRIFNDSLDICNPIIMDVIDESLPKKGPEYEYDHSQSAFYNVAEGSLFYMKLENHTIEPLVEDIEKVIISQLDIKSLVALTKTNKSKKKLALSELVERLNQGKINPYDIGLKNDKDLINFLDDECNKIHYLNLYNLSLVDTDWNELAKRFDHLNILKVIGDTPTILKMTNKFASVVILELFHISNLKAFDKLVESCPSIKKLLYAAASNFYISRSSDIEITNFSTLKNCPFLTEIEFRGNLPVVTGVDSCKSLEKISFIDCHYLKNIDMLENCPRLTHLSIDHSKITEINGDLTALKYFHADNHYPLKNYDLLNKSTELEVLSLGGLGHILKEGLKIKTLELFNFGNSVIQDIKICTSLKT
ncbi:MAG TPA: hypothetical protein VGP47_08180, partial [Parachlamydiaceae bacterium]|nr:hypothetical protein [Parachlamydiaceae bacterium]